MGKRMAIFAIAVAAMGMASGVGGVPVVGAASTATISARFSLPSTTLGKTVQVTGTVSPAGATPHVVVQRLLGGHWVDRATATVSPATGAFRAAITPSQPGTSTLRVRSAGGSVASAPLFLTVTRTTTIIAALSAGTVTVGTPVEVFGSVIAANATTRVVAQQAMGGRWVDLGGGAVDRSTGKFRVQVAAGGQGRFTLRVRSNGGSVASNELHLQVVTVTPVAPPTTRPAPSSLCDPNYSGCVPIASDVDCAGGSGNGPAYVQGPINVIGVDIYDLDRDGDGIACEDG